MRITSAVGDSCVTLPIMPKAPPSVNVASSNGNQQALHLSPGSGRSSVFTTAEAGMMLDLCSQPF
jgi:hypothetical protein